MAFDSLLTLNPVSYLWQTGEGENCTILHDKWRLGRTGGSLWSTRSMAWTLHKQLKLRIMFRHKHIIQYQWMVSNAWHAATNHWKCLWIFTEKFHWNFPSQQYNNMNFIAYNIHIMYAASFSRAVSHWAITNQLCVVTGLANIKVYLTCNPFVNHHFQFQQN